jgi:peptide/nickel transport system permease protein
MAAQVPDTAVLAVGGDPRLRVLLVSQRQIRLRQIGEALKLWVPAGFVVLVLAICFVLPYVVTLPSATHGSILDASDPPFSAGHWLGTDAVGNDIFAQIVYGGQVSFEVAFATTGIGILAGSLLGITAGYFGGWADTVLSRLTDVLLAFPALVLALAISQGLGQSEFHVILSLSVFSIPALARVTRAATLTIRELPYMTAARLSGTRGWRAILTHVVPNILPGIVSFSLLGIGIVIILEGALDFLGYGIPISIPTWGQMIANGQNVISAQPQYVLIPSIFLVIVVGALNLFGDALRDRWGSL